MDCGLKNNGFQNINTVFHQQLEVSLIQFKKITLHSWKLTWFRVLLVHRLGCVCVLTSQIYAGALSENIVTMGSWDSRGLQTCLPAVEQAWRTQSWRNWTRPRLSHLGGFSWKDAAWNFGFQMHKSFKCPQKLNILYKVSFITNIIQYVCITQNSNYFTHFFYL